MTIITEITIVCDSVYCKSSYKLPKYGIITGENVRNHCSKYGWTSTPDDDFCSECSKIRETLQYRVNQAEFAVAKAFERQGIILARQTDSGMPDFYSSKLRC